ncbi:LLM class flavin-dependent oxidoreductase [Streptomyces kaniharaensis]|uniref:LLM class flavin-dependent oxidoreductase n=1 Tax=Streptomyces kaniharaensis TaxID=212423 RepID=A0A5S9FY53_9ACTN|nr:LLM class flavin-dependent oxidoreductase [Streptomyces kaniharaensis]AVW82951.1 putative monooxygenase [Streptomyces kaniharaensis]MQS11302.1 LLM class flavin-dependent oxidoreductase [Streptomyces kaniharaensis]QTK22486.1 ForE [Streptomyces kaniharaensis]
MTGLVLAYELSDAVLAGPAAGIVVAAERAEAAGVHALLLGDRPAARPGRAAPPAAIVAASMLAVRTRRIGLVVDAAPAYCEPYNLARMIASLDHISGGRAGWRVVTGPDPEADANHRREGVDPAVGREVRAAEFVPLLRDLWDTWEDGAFVHEKDVGRFIDPDRVHVLDHAGPALQVRGPLNVVRPPQGHPVVLAPAAEPLLAPEADVLVAGNPDRAAASDRPVLGTVTPFVAETQERARELHARAGAPRSDGDCAVLVGDAASVAGQLAAWADRAPVDGFVLRLPLPGSVEVFTDLVLPELRASGRYSGEFRAGTLRGHLGLARPANRIVGRLTAAGAERS